MKQHLLILAAVTAASCVFASGPPLEVVVWTELEAFPEEAAQPPEIEARRAELLEQARRILSGMIYGYRFLYTPSDRTRAVADRFELEPLGEIRWGDPRLAVMWVQRQQGRLVARIGYEPAEHQQARRRAWSSNALSTSSGRGEYSIFGGLEARQAALEKAIEQAVREYARGRMDNKPRELRGELVIWEPPRTVLGPSRYVTTVTVKVNLSAVVPYRVY